MANIKRKGGHIRVDNSLKGKLLNLKKRIELIQGVDKVSFSEITRRIGVSKSFEIVSEELIRDAEIKKRLGIK